MGWLVGWLEKDSTFFPFAYIIRNSKIELAQRIIRVKQLLADSRIVAAEEVTVQAP